MSNKLKIGMVIIAVMAFALGTLMATESHVQIGGLLMLVSIAAAYLWYRKYGVKKVAPKTPASPTSTSSSDAVDIKRSK